MVFFKEDVDKSGKSFDVVTEIEIVEEESAEQAAEREDSTLWEEWKQIRNQVQS